MTGRTLGYAVLATVLLTAGCSGSDDDHEADGPTVSEQLRELDAAPKVEPEGDASPDRDPDAVTAALWELDPCKLIAPEPGKRGTIDQYSPHGCSLRLGHTEIRLEIGQRLQRAERLQLGATDVAGAKAYLLPGGPRLGGCTAWLPVSSTQTITIEDGFAECRRVRPVLERVVNRIDDPRSRRPVPGLGYADTCTLLRRGLGSQMRGRQVAYGHDEMHNGIDHCVALSDELNPESLWQGDEYASLELKTYATQTLTFEEGISDTPTPADYAASGWPADFGTIRGREVFGTRDSYGGGCTMRWAESTTILMLHAKSCEQGRQIAARMMKARGGALGKQITPQERLLYRADEPDRAASGACADYLPLWFGREYTPYNNDLASGPACHPYAEPDLPDGAAETVVAAEADPNVTCALAADAVHEEFAQRLRPATLDAYVPVGWSANPDLHDSMPPPFRARPCVFVDPRREIQVQVFVSSDPMAISPDLADQLEKIDSAMRTEVAPASYGIGTGYLIGLGEHPDDPGYVAVFVGRRHEQTDGGQYGPMQGSEDDVARVADAIVDEHLSEAS